MVATKALNLLSAVVILVAGVYVMLTFGDVLDHGSKMVLGSCVLAYAVVRMDGAFGIRVKEETDSNGRPLRHE